MSWCSNELGKSYRSAKANHCRGNRVRFSNKTLKIAVGKILN